jgi:uncharacterized protein
MVIGAASRTRPEARSNSGDAGRAIDDRRVLSMEIKGEYRLTSDRDRVWSALNDRALLEKCIPGCEALEQTAEHEFQGRIAAAVGPVKAKFDTRMRLENLNPPESYTITGESKAGAAGFGRGSADVVLAPAEDGTLLSYTAEFKVGGRLAQVGSRLVAGATKKVADEFFSCLVRELDGGAAEPAPAVAEPSAADAGRRKWAIAAAVGAAAGALLAGWILLR